jgi:hypothetical protein
VEDLERCVDSGGLDPGIASYPPSPLPLPHLLQQRFTEKAIQVVMLAQEEARRLGHNFVGTEQVSRCASLYARARPPAPPTPPHVDWEGCPLLSKTFLCAT